MPYSLFNESSTPSTKNESDQHSKKLWDKAKFIIGAGLTGAVGAAGAYVVYRYSQYPKNTLSATVTGLSLLPTASNEYIVGNEFLVNTYTTSDQSNPSVAELSNGGFVVTWSSYEQDGSSYGIYGQRYDSAGAVQGNEFLVNTFTTSYQYSSSVAGLSDGGFVVTWNSEQDGDGFGVCGQRYDSAGVMVGIEFQVNTYTTSYQDNPSVAGLTNGGFVVTWDSDGQDGSGNGVYGQRFDNSGAIQDSEFQVNAYIIDYQGSPSGVSLASGGFVVTWNSILQDGSAYGIYGQRYDSVGDTVGSEFQVNTYTTDHQASPSVAALATGGFVVTWLSNGQDGYGFGIYGQRFGSSNNTQGEFQVNTYTIDSQESPSVATLTTGGFVVTWQSLEQDGDLYGVYGQFYDSAGVTVGSEFLVNTYTTNNQQAPSVAALTNGGFVVTWESAGQDGESYGIYGKMFTPPESPPSPPPPNFLQAFLTQYAGAIIVGGASLAAITFLTTIYLVTRKAAYVAEKQRLSSQRHNVGFSPSTQFSKSDKQPKPLRVETPHQLYQVIKRSPALQAYIAGEIADIKKAGLNIMNDNEGNMTVLVKVKTSRGVEKTIYVPKQLLESAKQDYKLFGSLEVFDVAATMRAHKQPTTTVTDEAKSHRSIGTTTSGVSIVRQVDFTSETDIENILKDVEMQSINTGVSKVIRITSPEQLERILEILPGLTDAMNNVSGNNPMLQIGQSQLSITSTTSQDSIVIRIKSDADVEQILEIKPSLLAERNANIAGNNSFFKPVKNVENKAIIDKKERKISKDANTLSVVAGR